MIRIMLADDQAMVRQGFGALLNAQQGMAVVGEVTNGEDVRVTVWMKPISTLMKPLRSVDLSTMAEAAATIERSDVCAVPAAAVVGEAMVSLVLGDALIEKFGGDSVAEIDAAWERYQDVLSARLAPRPEPA